MNPLLHGILPQTKVPQRHQGKATVLLPASAIICQNDSYNNRCRDTESIPCEITLLSQNITVKKQYATAISHYEELSKSLLHHMRQKRPLISPVLLAASVEEMKYSQVY